MGDGLCERLHEARRNLSRQLEVLQSPATVNGNPRLVPPDNRALIADLQGQLREINTAIAELKSDEA